MYASRTRKEEFSGHNENCQKNASDLEGSLVTSSRPPGRLQKSPDDRTSNGGVAAQAADGSRRTVGAADERCRRCRRSSLSCTVVPCTANIGGPLHTACTAPTREQASAVCRAVNRWNIVTYALLTDYSKLRDRRITETTEIHEQAYMPVS